MKKRPAKNTVKLPEEGIPSAVESEQRFRTVFLDAPFGIVKVDRTFHFERANESFCRMTGYTEPELLKFTFADITHPEFIDKDIESVRKLLTGQIPVYRTQKKYIRKDGTFLWGDVTVNAIRDNNGDFLYFVAIIDDITEQKDTENKLKQSEAQYRLLADNTSDGVWLLDMNLKLIYCSPASEKQSGFTSREIMDMSLEQYFTPESLKVISNAFLVELPKVQADPSYNGPFSVDLEYYKKDGTSFWAESKFSIVRDKLGKPEYILGVARDITERRQAEEKLRDREELFRNVFDNSYIGKSITSIEGTVNANQALADMLGYTQEELSCFKWQEVSHPDDIELTNRELEPLRKGQKKSTRFIKRYIKKDGSFIWADISTVLQSDNNDKPLYYITTVVDITEAKKAEEALLKSEERYRLLAEHTMDTVWLMDMNVNLIYFSPSVEKMRGFTTRELIEMPVEQHVTPNSLKLVNEVILQEIPRVEADANYNPVITLNLEYTCKNGTTIWTENIFSVIRDENGKPISILGEARDISERKRIEEALRKSEELFRVTQEMSPDGFTILHPLRNEKGEIIDFTWVYENKTIARINGTDPAEVKGKRMLDLFPTHKATSIFEAYISVSNSGKPQVIEEVYVGEIVSRPTWLRLVIVSIGEDIAILAQDITERKQSEEKLLKSYESLKKTLNDSINTMVKIVELRDPYTAGHQQKVADLAVAIAGEMKFDDTQIDQLRTAAVIHDIGKIYIPSDILSKPGKLGDIELNLIKTHAQNGYNIVKGMDFPGAVAETILQHHERLDGSGYPSGLKAEDMLMKAKILAVADVVEAMAAHRPYRPALGIDSALEEISKNKGKLYDPDVVDACLTLFNEKGFVFLE